MKRLSNQKRVLLVLLCLCLVFIWGNSCLSVPQSQGLSNGVLSWLCKLLGLEAGEEAAPSGSHLIRKLAHFSEFACLGLLFSALCGASWKLDRQCFLALLLFGLSAALIDETIQCFTGRGSMVSDVWLDLAGYLVGCLVKICFFSSKNNKK